jgi:hypothetical protein
MKTSTSPCVHLVAVLFLLAGHVALLPAGAARANDPRRLPALTPQQATELVAQAKPLQLMVTELSPEVAEILAGLPHELRFNALTSLTPEAAAALAKRNGPLLLQKVAALTPATAAALAMHRHEINLPGVTVIGPDEAAALAPHAGLLVLGVTELSDDTAAALAKHVGDIVLNGLPALTSLPLAERIGKQTVVRLGGVKRITPEIARALNPPVDLQDKALGYRWIDIGLTELSPEAGAAIVASRHGFGMHSLESISPEAAAGLASPFTNMRMWGLKTISPATATALAKTRGILDIRMFGPELPDDTARAFASQADKGGWPAIDFGGLKKLTVPEFAVIVVGRANLHGGLGGVAELSDDVARALADCKDPLKPLPSLTSLTSAPLAAKYAGQPGDVTFKKLASIPDDVAAALATHKGKVDLSGLKSLSVPAARACAAHEGTLVLDGLEEIGDEAAAALAKAIGPVSLKGLKQVSPAARAALAANAGIGLPPAPAAP